jgi:hypothetical protein
MRSDEVHNVSGLSQQCDTLQATAVYTFTPAEWGVWGLETQPAVSTAEVNGWAPTDYITGE